MALYYELFVNILRVWCVIAFEFFPRCIVSVSDVDVPRVVSIAEDLTEGGGVPQGVPPPNGGKGVPPPSDGNFVRLVERGVPPPNGGNFVRLVERGVTPPNGSMLFAIVCQI